MSTTLEAQAALQLPHAGAIRFAAARRAFIRFQGRQTTRRIIIEALALHTEPRHNRRPLFVRLEALQTRYSALGGDPTDLLR
jgi:hypothetical protein